MLLAVFSFAIWIFFFALSFLLSLVLPGATSQTAVIVSLPLAPLAVFIAYGISSRKEKEKFFYSERAARLATAFVALCGLAFASYLSFEWYSGGVAQCGSGGCATAQASKYADMFFGIPTSTVGIFGYTMVLLSLLLGGDWGRMITAALGTIGIAVSAFLTFSSITVLETTCQWCLGSASAMTVIFALSVLRVARQDS